jgi:hypothetical protein
MLVAGDDLTRAGAGRRPFSVRIRYAGRPMGSALSLIKAVLELVADRRTGVLDVRSDGVRTQIYFDDGKPQFADDEALGETFGRLLVRQGVISNDQFVRVIDEMTRAAAGNSQLRFGEVAVGLGVLTPVQVEQGLGEQVCGIITRSLQRGESQWTFIAAPAAARPPRSFPLEINASVLDALRQSPDRSAIADVVAARPAELVVVTGPRPVADVRDDARAGAAADAHAARMAAEQAFQKGLALLRDTKTASAAIELRRASEMQPDSLEYLLYATWAKSRSYREIPLEADRQALLEIAQQAKKRDPMFAFASYVIGQLAMWAGDDATAKKWFYEALRIDPSSEAAKQVRILARRGGEPAAPPGGEEPTAAPARPPEDEPAPMPASEPPAQAAPSGRPAAPAGGSTKGLVAVVALLAAGGVAYLGYVGVTKPADPEPGPARTAPPPPVRLAIVADAAVSADAQGAAASALAVDGAIAQEREDGGVGTVLLPSRAADHRIFVDGRRARTDGVAPLRLKCGPHVIQIGSGGTPETVDVPCGGEVQLE